MRTILFSMITSAALLSGAGCKTNHDQDRVEDQTPKNQKDVSEARRDLATPQRTDKAAEDDRTAARAKYGAELNERLARLDAKIDELSHRADAKSHEIADRLRVRRDELKAKIDTLSNRAAAGWDDFKKDVDTAADTLEQDIKDATR